MTQQWMPPIYWDGDAVAILDQRILPLREKVLLCTTPDQVIKAIKTMAIRGAPAVGVAGALALALGAASMNTGDANRFRQKFSELCRKVREARPTGANLGWAVEKIYSVLVENPRVSIPELRELIRAQADAISGRRHRGKTSISENWGREVVPRGARILTYCNAARSRHGRLRDWLSGVIRAPSRKDPTVQVYSCETRPFLQGARLLPPSS